MLESSVKLWQRLGSWLVEYPHTNMYHNLFINLFSLVLASDCEPALRAIIKRPKKKKKKKKGSRFSESYYRLLPDIELELQCAWPHFKVLESGSLEGIIAGAYIFFVGLRTGSTGLA